ncbi:hypothetical protein MPTK1_6g21440 [Marchantia polymorpha subsp. ruderalis]|uniref:PhoD-like phosphatase metallophosphatase domain-containing protein n=4 Tax=Marchantia polymorpha TaxID=3197 RepID=A0AAF6BUJ0_MARPO|nr:hypothetical protein MARPO_0091s0011 [Marchantia polymorpha]PTQ33141.1 hypothetical protein MARPO_0091s0011 [Marchantia polymorpha]BBN15673.1 hypothetical protein Mp_6g21440 [Marchantia polymorpha subsp. ruderalis]BBN15674.1 hypothetical protein Mp_6g21440 [Marchantia polymorpha subsp. ruderalis]|eukprot:PTQ33140.1 hypothetical protein MARPO_0091s0011 [Marchantia polymorpha]
MKTVGRRRRAQVHQYEKLADYISPTACLACFVLLFWLSASLLHTSRHDPIVTRSGLADTANWGRSNQHDSSLNFNFDSESTNPKIRDSASKVGKLLGVEDQAVNGESDSLVRAGKGDFELVSRVAFGSCTSRRDVYQPIWRQGVIPSSPQAWIWAGDIAYMDWPDTNCKEKPEHFECNCTRDWLHVNRQTCLAGDVAHARKKLEIQLQNPDYQQFVEYMCPDIKNLGSGHRDLSLCARPIVGTWDDHDYNWQDGDKRLPNKEQQKKLYLDAFGVPSNSPRREKDRGIYWKHTLNEGTKGKEIDVFLLDERFHRDNKPCETRREFCEKVAVPDPKKYKHAWCKDFIFGGADGKGSCCRKDEQIWAGWCKENSQLGDDLWEAACDPTSETYGFPGLEIDISSGGPIRAGPNSNTTHGEGVLCEVIGVNQRAWLQDELRKSEAPLKLIVSGSPVFNNPEEFVCSKALKRRPSVNCTCFDDYDCYRPAQLNLLHNLAQAPGCVVVLTGDFHFSDIKVLQPGSQKYSGAYDSFHLPRAIYQIMASGLTTDTAQHAPCDGYRIDKAGFRPEGECAFVSGPAFGMIEIDWDTPEQLAKLQIRDEFGVVTLESTLRLDKCTPV